MRLRVKQASCNLNLVAKKTIDYRKRAVYVFRRNKNSEQQEE